MFLKSHSSVSSSCSKHFSIQKLFYIVALGTDTFGLFIFLLPYDLYNIAISTLVLPLFNFIAIVIIINNQNLKKHSNLNNVLVLSTEQTIKFLKLVISHLSAPGTSEGKKTPLSPSKTIYHGKITMNIIYHFHFS